MTKLDQLEKLLAEATPGEWRYSRCYGVATIETKDGKPIAHAVEYLKVANADTIVELRNNAANLIAVARAAKALRASEDEYETRGRRENLWRQIELNAVALDEALAKLEGGDGT